MQLSLGISPCPNDTFIFDWLINKWEQRSLLAPVLHDVQELNEMVLAQHFDVAKISYATLPAVLENYIALRAGGALGEGVGPLLIGKTPPPADWASLVNEVQKTKVALPGKNTTANLLFHYAFSNATQTTQLVFNTIEQFAQQGEGLGVIIHESRFTYQQHGLYKWLDLGEYWQRKEALPIPLGVIVIRKSLAAEFAGTLNACIQKSLEHSWSGFPVLSDFVTHNASEMDEHTMRDHINLYVNGYSVDVGELGIKAVQQLLNLNDVSKLFYR